MAATTWFVWLLVFCALTLAGAVVAVFQARRSGGQGAGCGRCGYPVIGLPTSTCPECGCDLEVAGTRPPTPWRRLLPSTRKKVALGAWTVWLAVAALLAVRPFHEHIRPGTRWSCESVVLDTDDGRCRVQIDRMRSVYGWPWQPRPAFANVVPEGWRVHVHPPDYIWQSPIDIQDLRYASYPSKAECGEFIVHERQGWFAFSDPDTGQLSHRDGSYEQELQKWLDSWERKFNRRGLRQEVLLALQTARSKAWEQMASGTYPGFRSAKPGGCYYWRPDTRCDAGGIALVLLIWALGCVGIWRRMQARPSAQAVADAR